MPSSTYSSRDSCSRCQAKPDDVAGVDIQSESDAYRRMLQRVRRFARADDPVVLEGESGTGKTKLAELIHALSPRAHRPYLVVNMAELDDNLASSELFGHLRGAYTGADLSRKGAFVTAQGGTILLDECGKASLANQGRLLRVIETQRVRPVGADVEVPVDTRIIFAASEPLEQLVESGRMLRDFLPRLGAFRIAVPPLRERREDIPRLIKRLVAVHAPHRGYESSNPPTILPELVAALVAYDWPNNVRELDGLMRRLLIDAEGSPSLGLNLLIDDLAKYHSDRRRHVPLGERHKDIARAIEEAGGNRSEAARYLCISRSTLNRHLNAAPKQTAADTKGSVLPEA